MKTINYIAIYGLSVFAYNPQSAPGNNTGSSTLTDEMTKFYSKRLIERMLPNLVFYQFGEKEPIPRNSGKTINWRHFNSYAPASTLTEGVTPDPTTLTVTSVSVTVVQLGAFTPYTDLLEMTAIDPVVAEISSLHAEQAALTIDTQVRNELTTSTSVTQVRYAPIIGTSGNTEVTARGSITDAAKLTVDVVANVVTDLRRANAPTIDGTNYAMIIHPSVAHDLMRDKEWIEASKYTENVDHIYKGEIGMIYGMRFFQTTRAKVTLDGAKIGSTENKYATYDCIALGKDAFKVCDIGKGVEVFVKQLGSGGTSDPLNQRATIGWKAAAFAVKVVRPACIVRVVCGSSNGTKDTAN